MSHGKKEVPENFVVEKDISPYSERIFPTPWPPVATSRRRIVHQRRDSSSYEDEEESFNPRAPRIRRTKETSSDTDDREEDRQRIEIRNQKPILSAQSTPTKATINERIPSFLSSTGKIETSPKTPPITAVGVQPSRMAATIDLPDFNGEPWENSKRWVSQFEFAWTPMRTTYGDSEAAKCTFFDMKLKGKAGKWASNLNEDVTTNFKKFSEALTKRFPKQSSTISTTDDALTRLMNLKQSGKSYEALFEEVEEIARDLPAELEPQISSALITSLDDEFVSKLAGGLFFQDPDRSVVRAQNVIRGAAGRSFEESRRATALEGSKRGPYFPTTEHSALFDFMDKREKSLEMRDENYLKTIQSITEQFKSLNFRSNQGTTRNQQGNNGQGQGSGRYQPQGTTEQNNGNNQYQNRPNQGQGAYGQGYQQSGGAAGGLQGGVQAPPGVPVFQPQNSNFRCYKCGEVGHTSRQCINNPAPKAERDRIYAESQQQRANRPQAPGATYPNNIPLDQQQQRVQQVKSVEQWTPQVVSNSSPYIDEWTSDDENMYVRESIQVEDIEWDKDDEVLAAAGKRVIQEVDTDDEESQTQLESHPRKQAKTAPWTVPSTAGNSEVGQTSGNDTQNITGQSKHRGETTSAGPSRQPFQLAATTSPKKGKAPARPRLPKGAPPMMKPKGMGNQAPWDAAGFTQETVVNITLAQLLQFAPKARVALAEAIKLESNPTRKKTTKKTRFAEDEEMDGVEQVEHVYSAETVRHPSRKRAAFDKRHPVEKVSFDRWRISEPASSRSSPTPAHPCVPCSEDVNRRIQVRMQQSAPKPDPKIGKSLRRPPISGNFYTIATITPRKTEGGEYTIRKCLVDPGSTLNLISESIARDIGCIFYSDTSINIKIANGDVIPLEGFVKALVTVASVPKVLIMWVVPGKTSYSLILGRPWLRSVNAIGYYGLDEYWILDHYNIHRQLEYSGPTQTSAPEVLLSEEAELDQFDEEILYELEYSEDERYQDILKEIERQGIEQQWEEFEELGDSEEGLKEQRL